MKLCLESSFSPDIDDENGQASFSLSGDIQAPFEGEAFFMTVNPAGVYSASRTVTDEAESFKLAITKDRQARFPFPPLHTRLGCRNQISRTNQIFLQL